MSCCAVPCCAADIVRELASAFHVREDLRSIISSALVKLCKQARAVALAALNPTEVISLSALNLVGGGRGQQGLEATAAAVPAEALEVIRALGLVSAAAAAVPRPEGAAEDEEAGGHEEADSDEEFEEYGAAAAEGGSSGGRRHGQQQQQRWRRQCKQQQQEEEEGGPDGASHAPEAFTAAVALAQLQALRAFSSHWMTLLCRVYIDVSGCLPGLCLTGIS